jgi:hypothetical protein
MGAGGCSGRCFGVTGKQATVRPEEWHGEATRHEEGNDEAS